MTIIQPYNSRTSFKGRWCDPASLVATNYSNLTWFLLSEEMMTILMEYAVYYHTDDDFAFDSRLFRLFSADAEESSYSAAMSSFLSSLKWSCGYWRKSKTCCCCSDSDAALPVVASIRDATRATTLKACCCLRYYCCSMLIPICGASAWNAGFESVLIISASLVDH